jgi:hydrogenase-4 component B
MLAAMALLAALCLLAGALPWRLVPALERAVASWTGAIPGAAASLSLDSLAPMRKLTMVSSLAAAAVAAIALALRLILRGKPAATRGTWDCGYARPTERMQYTGASIASGIVSSFPMVSPIRKDSPKVEGDFPAPAAFKADMPDATMDRLVLPVKNLIARAAAKVHAIQRGELSLYLLYVFAATILLLAFGAMGVS